VLLVGEDDTKSDAAGSVNGEGLGLATLVQQIFELLQVSRNEPLGQFDSEQRPWN
jgi:hypothetical protein